MACSIDLVSYSDKSISMAKHLHDEIFVDMDWEMSQDDVPEDHRVRVAADRRQRMLAQLSAAAVVGNYLHKCAQGVLP